MSGDPGASAARAIVEAVRQGDPDAFGGIVGLYERRLFGLALMLTRDPSGAEEVVQDAFVRAFVHLDGYDSRRPFYPWLATIAVRLAQNWLARRRRVGRHQGAELAASRQATGTEGDPLDALIAGEEDRALWRAVSALPAGERAAVILHYRQEMSVAEIAAILGVTAGTVKVQLFRGRTKLRHVLSSALNDGRRD